MLFINVTKSLGKEGLRLGLGLWYRSLRHRIWHYRILRKIERENVTCKRERSNY
jgi:hypothetical protein